MEQGAGGVVTAAPAVPIPIRVTPRAVAAGEGQSSLNGGVVVANMGFSQPRIHPILRPGAQRDKGHFVLRGCV